MAKDIRQTAAKTAGDTPAAIRTHAAASRTACLALRRNRDAVCRDHSADCSEQETAFEAATGAEFPGSGAISKQFFTSRMKSQPQTRKETPNTTQEKKGTQTTSNHSFARKP